MSSEANKRQVGGSHYASAYQHWDFAAELFGPGYFKGQATKYVMRARKKNGIQDLEKALHFLDKLAEVDWKELGWIEQRPAGSVGSRCIPRLARENGLNPEETGVISRITHARNKAEVLKARLCLLQLIDQMKTQS